MHSVWKGHAFLSDYVLKKPKEKPKLVNSVFEDNYYVNFDYAGYH